MYNIDKPLCFRVDINVEKPLRRVVNVMAEGKCTKVRISYVKLPIFLIHISLWHVAKGCDHYHLDTFKTYYQYGECLPTLPRSKGAHLSYNNKLIPLEKHSSRSKCLIWVTKDIISLGVAQQDGVVVVVVEHLNRAKVEKTLSQINPHITPNLDSPNALFYQTQWDIIGDDECSAILAIL
ncbi:LOW QUALITY PROTEIN: hypothetical protein Cgig2_030757 [Carnegiea gigantea]|uniref:Uncharacterized protein n=1 Tax=Carnegiea gigantea TaxID=171969 RepID=A0A9Q1KQD9_9CARY|nr:LOW QUALITY PROTEIN: hypothetical protein Cgig2_030757 [Carnegiea gigantea]